MEGTELLAKAFQHEIDHLDGILLLIEPSRSRRLRYRVENRFYGNSAICPAFQALIDSGRK